MVSCPFLSEVYCDEGKPLKRFSVSYFALITRLKESVGLLAASSRLIVNRTVFFGLLRWLSDQA